ncbi:MAG: aminoglycoside phosphotransferase family protein [Verrucomicrobiota bacterium]
MDETSEMELAEIEKLTRKALPSWGQAEIQLTPIEKGGSGRVFARVKNLVTGEQVVVVHYNLDRPDNERFAPVTEFLNRHGIPSPRLIAWDEGKHCVWVEDLGARDLGDLETADWERERRPAYFSTLETVRMLHRIKELEPPQDLPMLEPPFDEALYQWEQAYFLEHYVSRFHSSKEVDYLRKDASLQALREHLSALGRCLVHRDFQSTNVMLYQGKTCLIDYQGMRWGVPEYDLASLVFDPYTDFTPSERSELADYYFSLKQADGEVVGKAEFRSNLNRCGTQRLMQALGAYGFLGEVKRKTEFLEHIPAAKARLIELSQEEGGIAVLGELLK